MNNSIILKKIKVHNLKGIDLKLNHGEIIVFTGISGSGKSSLAFDTIYLEGQRRYLEAMSHASKKFLEEIKKPDFEDAKGLSPTIAIEQKTASKNPRSTLGTLTGIYDYLRLLFSKKGVFHCPISNEIVKPQTKEEIKKKIDKLEGKTVYILANYAKNKKSNFIKDFKELLKKGFIKIRINKKIYDLNEIKELNPNIYHTVDIVVDIIKISSLTNENRLIDSINSALEIGKGFFQISYENKEKSFSIYAYAFKSKKSYPPLTPSDFSFNHPDGMCKRCHGLGEIFTFDIEKIINKDLSIEKDCCSIAPSYETIKYKNIYDNLARIYKFKINTPWKKLDETIKNIFLYGVNKKWIKMKFYHPIKKIYWTEYIKWEGVLFEAETRLNKAKSEIHRKKIEKLMNLSICPDCHGHGLKKYPLATTYKNKKIFEITKMTIEEAFNFFQNIKAQNFEKDIVQEILKRLEFLKEINLGYLSLNRKAPSLSGGEAQRVRLSSQMSMGLIGSIYILDEPTIGLHPQDNKQLIEAIKKLQKKGNTIILVEHDRDMILAANTIVDIGPFAGKDGGKIIFQGKIDENFKKSNSITAKYLFKKEQPISIKPQKLLKKKKFLTLYGASCNNLKDVNLKIPLNSFVCIVGVSGSGKSSLISDTLYPAIYNILQKTNKKCGKFKKIESIENIDKILLTDQSPIGKNIRSNPATYIKLLDPIRDFFAKLPEARAKGFCKGHFSFNVKEGTCPYCKGHGKIKIDMDFMEDEFEICPNCKGNRFDKEILSIKYKGKNIADILNMEVKEALSFFKNIFHIHAKLKILDEIGLGYIKLGQEAPSLSGGEAQRIKLAKELCKKNSEKTIYILDEPTIGLHFYDVENLLKIIQNLTKKGNTVIIIEHNIDIIKKADHIIELGPKSGKEGGKIIFNGSLNELLLQKTPTAKVLKEKKLIKTLKKEKIFIPQKIKTLNIKNAREGYLKNISLNIRLDKINVFTGPSGSGKTTVAFDVIYMEARRRYIETLALYKRSFFQKLQIPKVEKIENLPPTISIDQKIHKNNPRSTLGTLTEIYDHLRVLYAHLGTAYCPNTQEEIKKIDKHYIFKKIISALENHKVYILSFINFMPKESFSDFIKRLLKKGFLKIRINKKYFDLEDDIEFNPNLKNEILLVIDKLIVKKENENRFLESIQLASKISNNKIIIASEKKDFYFNLSFCSEKTGKSFSPITPKTFSFNSENGMCLNCHGLGFVYGIHLEENQNFLENSIEKILHDLFFDNLNKKILSFLKKFFSFFQINIKTSIKNLTSDQKNLFFKGSSKSYKFKNNYFRWRGINTVLEIAAKHANFKIKEFLIPFMQTKTCPLCFGKRLNKLACNVKIKNISICTLCSFSIKKALIFLNSISLQKKEFLKETLFQIKNKLQLLIDIGLDYLSLNRSAPTLSKGELQRTFIAKNLGAKLTNCLYILDEPTIGLHPYNTDLLIKALKNIKDLNNTIILIEHDLQMIKFADYIFDFGEKAGIYAGNIVAQGTFNQIIENKNSVTGPYLSHKKKIKTSREKKKDFKDFIHIKNATLHNLKNINVKIPKNSIVCITGVSGSGKSTLIKYILKQAIEKSILTKKDKIDLTFASISNIKEIKKVIFVDQRFSEITNRADVATYSEIMPPIRSLFASLPLAKAYNLKPRHFSYNNLSGMCRACFGLGYKKIDLKFMPDEKIKCDICHGYKLNSKSLKVKYKNKHIGHILDMSIDETFLFFENFSKITKKLNMLKSIGLGYLTLKTAINTLSGGEWQRLKLIKELSKRHQKNTLYLLDEPSIGLHFSDIEKLLKILEKLAQNSSLIIIEHNLNIISFADYIIDMGPFSGENGGQVLFSGPIKNFIKNKKSITAKYLKKIINF